MSEPLTFEALYNQHALYVHRRATWLIHDPELAADVEQQAWIKAWQHLDGLKPTNIQAWLATIVTRTAYDALLKQRTRSKYICETTLEAYTENFGESLELADENQRNPEDMVVDRDGILERQRRVQALLARLKPHHREALMRYHRGEHDPHDMAEKTLRYRATQIVKEHARKVGLTA